MLKIITFFAVIVVVAALVILGVEITRITKTPVMTEHDLHTYVQGMFPSSKIWMPTQTPSAEKSASDTLFVLCDEKSGLATILYSRVDGETVVPRFLLRDMYISQDRGEGAARALVCGEAAYLGLSALAER